MEEKKGLFKIPAFFRPRYPDLDWIQVEITSRCNAGCEYCPHHAWQRQTARYLSAL